MWFVLLFMVITVFSTDPIGDFVKKIDPIRDGVYKQQFQILHEYKDVEFAIEVPMYIVRTVDNLIGLGDQIIWTLYFIPKDFWEKVKAKREEKKAREPKKKSKKEEEPALTNNDGIRPEEFGKYFDIRDVTIEGGKITIQEDSNKIWVANVDDLRFKNAKLEHSISPSDGSKHPFKAMGLKWNLYWGDIKVTHLFSEAIDIWFKSLKIGKVTVQDNAYFPCGDAKPFIDPSVAQLFIRIWMGKTKDGASLYMKEAFGSFTLPGDRRVLFDKIANAVHDTTLGDLIEKLGIAKMPPKDIAELKKIITDANNNNIKSKAPMKNHLKKRNGIDKWDNKKVLDQTMGDIMTVLWYMGDSSKCGNYRKVFKWLYGEEVKNTHSSSIIHQDDEVDYPAGCLYKTDFCNKLHTLRSEVQHLEKILIAQPLPKIDLKKQSSGSIKWDELSPLAPLEHSTYDGLDRLFWYAFDGHSGYHGPDKVTIPPNAEINFFAAHAIESKEYTQDRDIRDKYERITKIREGEILKNILPGRTSEEFYHGPDTQIHDYVMNTAIEQSPDSAIYQYTVQVKHHTDDGTNHDKDMVEEVLQIVKVELPGETEPGISLKQFFESDWFKDAPGRVFYLGCRSVLGVKPKLQVDPFNQAKLKDIPVKKHQRNSISILEKQLTIEEESPEMIVRKKGDTYPAVVYKDNKYDGYDNLLHDEFRYNGNNNYGNVHYSFSMIFIGMFITVFCFCIGVLCFCIGGFIGYGASKFVNDERKDLNENHIDSV